MTHILVACARGWIGTRFHHQGRVKKTAAHKGGVDCLGLLIGIARELALRGPGGVPLIQADELDYSHQPNVKRLQDKLSSLLHIIPVGGIAPGDIVLLNIDDHPQHLAIVSDKEQGLGIIHAYAPAKAVVEHRLDSWWINRIEMAYQVPV